MEAGSRAYTCLGVRLQFHLQIPVCGAATPSSTEVDPLIVGSYSTNFAAIGGSTTEIMAMA